MDYRHLSTKHFVQSCQLQDNGYCSILPFLTKSASGLVNAPPEVAVVPPSADVQITGQMSAAVVGQQLSPSAAEITPMHLDLSADGLRRLSQRGFLCNAGGG